VDEFQMSCSRMTVLVVVDHSGRIVETAPIVQKFVGQGFDDLRGWMQKIGGSVRVTRLGGE